MLSPISGWSVLLGRKALKKASKQLREICQWPSDVPAIMSACLVSMEPDSSLRLMSDQFTPDERFGKTASHCQLSTPKDASATHILVFPTSATAQVSEETDSTLNSRVVIQSDHSRCSKPPVDIKTKVVFQHEAPVPKCNLCFGVNRRLVKT